MLRRDSGASVKSKLGACVYEMPTFLWNMSPVGKGRWVRIRNRKERLIPDAQRVGVQCDWRWTSDLHITKVFPRLGRSLMRRALREWPVASCPRPRILHENIKVSFIIGHRGRARVPHLLATLKSIAAQRHTTFECIVVEQSEVPELTGALPAWVRYVHVPPAHPGAHYCRSLAFNAGARAARGEMLVLHDNDLLVAQDYAAEIMSRYEQGYEVINLKRFIFYLTEAHARRVCVSGELDLKEAPESVMQNAQGGGSLAVSREAFFAIGGFDESFVGWGGEDNEFWERAQTLNVWPYGYLPLVHLWHEAQPGKFDQGRRTAALFERRSSVPVEERIEELRARNVGPGSSSAAGVQAGALARP